jgi:purine nucleosidase
MKVLLDTDIGNDVDDAVCLAYLLAQPDCDLLVVSTVTGRPSVRAALAAAVCRSVGHDVPIHAGARSPLVVEQRQGDVPQAAGIDPTAAGSGFPEGEAFAAVRSLIRKHPHEVVLVAIGPLTNVALLCAIDPDTAAMLRGLVIMGGDFSVDAPVDYNTDCDPHAAAIVTRAPIPWIRWVGEDITSQVAMEPPAVRERFTSPYLRPVLPLAEIMFREHPLLTFHDPLAAATLFDDAVCEFRRGHVTISVEPGTEGRITFRPDSAGSHEIAVSVDAERYFRHFFAVTARTGSAGMGHR